MKSRFFCAALLLLGLFWRATPLPGQTASMPAADSSSLDFKQFGLLAIQDGGRRKPVDTFARETLIKITGRSTHTAGAKTWQASDFILSMLLDTHDWKNEPMILVSLGELKEKLGLPGQQRRFSFAQLAALPELNALAGEAHALRKAEKPLSRLQSEVMSVTERLGLFAHIMDGSVFLLVPAPEKTTDAWIVPPAFAQYYKEPQFTPVQTQLQTMANGYAKGDSFAFSRAANQLREGLRGLSPKIYPEESQLRLEYFYNHWDGFYRAAWCYGIALLFLAIAAMRASWTGRSAGDAKTNPPGRSYLKIAGVIIVSAGLLFHASGIALRCLIAGRPPVTNMYESIIWVSFAVTFFGMIFFARYRAAVYLLAALPVSLVALLLVHQMPIAMPSSIDPLVPVLRDNFWLTIHVLTITLSYAAFALAMGFGHILLFRYARNPISARADQPMHFWLYRVLQLGVILLAAGTILGGVWANYSWGRFWGWDPKETWALIALLCYILTLHGRLAGWWTQFGLVVASVVCFLAVLMAWYGVNFILGKGLHSYGFGIGGENYVAGFVIADLLFVAFAIWRYRSTKAVRPVISPAAVRAEQIAT
ncbi:MAG TPA: cytochrome c biogenesis protein CcsA [Chthoniobacterales bacterium]|nr:cytochrome c biogenesis protein CcsA [Chthoniobacterales bacterium]